MAGIGGSHNEAFYSDGIGHTVNDTRANAGSLTLADDASGTDQGLADTSAKWAATTPHGVLQTALGGSEDTSWQDMQRTAGAYKPGQMPALQDQLSAGSDNH